MVCFQVVKKQDCFECFLYKLLKFLIQDPTKVTIEGEITAENPHVIVFTQGSDKLPVYIAGKR